MQKELVTPITHLEIGEYVYLPRPCFMKPDVVGGSAYDTYGTVTEVMMTSRGLPDYAEVFFLHIDGPQMLRRTSMARRGDGIIVSCTHHDIDATNKHNTCNCKYTSITK